MTDSVRFILLYCVAMSVAIVTQRLRVPYTAGLLLVGVGLGALHVVELPHLTRELLFALFLPGLLFEAAYHLELRELRESAWSIGALAVPGVIVAIGLTAALLMAGAAAIGAATDIGWTNALIFGGVIAATDPVAVTALFRELSAPRRLHVLVESESLLNDGTSIVFLTLLLAYFAGEAPTALSLGLSFLRIALGGAAMGLAIGWGISHIRSRMDHAAIEISLTTIAAYGSFTLAEYFHCSGVIATVVAGVMCGHTGRHVATMAGTREAVNSFWEWLAFVLNSAVFLLLGAELSTSVIAREWPLVLLAALAAFGARAAVVAAVSVAVSKSPERIPGAWSVIMVWGGLRGALSLVLALALPAESANRPLIVALTAGTVMLSLLGQGLTMPLMLRRFGIGAER